MIQIIQLPADYRHPNGYGMGGYWAVVVGDRVVVAAKEKSELENIYPEAV